MTALPRGKEMKLLKRLAPIAVLACVPTLGFAQEADTTPTMQDIGFILNTFMFLVMGFLVFFMAAGFALLEAGLVRGKNVTMQLTKNMALFSLASIFYYILGYNLMYPADAWTIDGVLGAFSITSLEPVGLEGAEPDLTYASVGSDFFFPLMFCAATASIVSGALAERIKLWPFLIFVIFQKCRKWAQVIVGKGKLSGDPDPNHKQSNHHERRDFKSLQVYIQPENKKHYHSRYKRH